MQLVIIALATFVVMCITTIGRLENQHRKTMQEFLNRCEAAQWDNQGRVTLMECSTLPDQHITDKAQPAPTF